MTRYLDVELRQVRLERGGRPVLRSLDWRIKPGERWVLVGGNGAGKTQLLKLLAGDVWPSPTDGEPIRYRRGAGLYFTPYQIKQEIAYIGAERQDKYERYGWDHRVQEVVGTGLYRTDIPLHELTAEDKRRIAALLRKLGITALLERRFLTLSYGERRLTLLARALAARPKLLLLDEPFNGLDERHRAILQHWLQSAARSRLPWVLATHHATDVPATATHLAVLERGRFAYRGRCAPALLRNWTSPPATAPRAGTAPRRRPGTMLVRLARANVYLGDTPVLRHLSFQIQAGECWVVHGPNGSGKSTLLRAIYGDRPVAGVIERAGIVPGVPLAQFRRWVGWIAPHLQADHPLYLTVAQVVQSGRYASIGLNEPPTAADRRAATQALAAFGLTRLARLSLRELSYGQLRRVLFARAWVRKPRLLLLDEPFAGIDGPTRNILMQRVEKAIRQGTAVVIATHHRDEWPQGVTHELQLGPRTTVYCGPVGHHS